MRSVTLQVVVIAAISCITSSLSAQVESRASRKLIPAVMEKTSSPKSGVRLTEGVFQQAFENNIGYLKSLSLDSTLYWFRVKAGLPAPGEPYRGHFEDNIKGQTAGLYLMGAANSLRWKEDPELRANVETIVNTIEKAAEPDGFFEPIPKSEFGTKEYPNYVRVWMNYGLKAASLVGNQKALPLMRNMQTWFNHCDERFIARNLMLAFQGVIANTTVALSDVGLPEDLDAVVNYYQEDWWLGQFIRGDQDAIHKRPTPHGTELEAITAYLEMYLATGKPYYLNAVNGAYKMFQDKWEHVGGGIVTIEMTDIAPGCYWLDPIHYYNELCSSAHWLYLNQKYHHLYQDREKYVNEIEKTLYNIVVANQDGKEHIRYHAYIDIQKDREVSTPVSCCAGLGTRVLGSLPEFLYSLDPEGINVDIYSNSEITWMRGQEQCILETRTNQPTGGNVNILVKSAATAPFSVRLRIPQWTAQATPILVNGRKAADGAPGNYCDLKREWRSGDTISLSLPIRLRTTKYSGLDTLKGCDRYAYEWGPLLLGIVGRFNYRGRFIQLNDDPLKPETWAIPIDGKPGHFKVRNEPAYEIMPYHEIRDEVFTCYPIFRSQ